MPTKKKALKRRADMRNRFAHIQPISWSTQAEGLPAIVGAASSLIRHLNDHPAVHDRDAVRLALAKVDAELAAFSGPPRPTSNK